MTARRTALTASMLVLFVMLPAIARTSAIARPAENSAAGASGPFGLGPVNTSQAITKEAASAKIKSSRRPMRATLD